MLAMQFQLERSQWWTGDELREHQFRQLRQLLGHAVSAIPYYRKLGDLPIGPSLDETSFRRWPLLRKKDVLGNDAAMRASAWPKQQGGKVESATTGSTGNPVRLAFTEAAQFITHALVLRNYLWHRVDMRGKLAVINPHLQDAHGPNWGLITGAAFHTGPIATLNIAADIEQQLAWVCDQAPAYLQTRPTSLRSILMLSRETGRKPAGLRAVITQSEMLHAGLRELAQEVWGVPIIDTYSCGEFGLVALQCPRHEHYHVQAESVHVEVLDDQGNPCAPGQTGRVVVTTLHNFAMPLIRYEIGDYAEAGALCACGRGLPVLKRILGRQRNLARDPTGRRFWPSFHAPLWLQVANFKQVRLLQPALDRIEVEYVLERDLTPDEMASMEAALHGSLRYPFKVNFKRVASIARSPGEKFEDFVSLLGEQ